MAQKIVKKIPIGAMRFVASESHAHVEFAEGDDKEPKMKMVAYSGKIMKGHWFWDDLVLDLKGIIFDRSKYPVLEQHDKSKKIAFTSKPIVTDDFKLKLDENKTVFVDTEESAEFQKLSRKGFPYESSVYVTPLNIERLDKGASAEVNGFTLKGPGTIFRKFRFNEASVCVFGWDRQTQASAFSKEEVDIELEEETLSQNVNNTIKKEVNKMPFENVTELSKENPELVKQIQDAVKIELTKSFDAEKKILTDSAVEKDKLLLAKDRELAGKDERVLKLEKNDSIRSEREVQGQANSVWTAKLSESDIPEHLYDKVRNQIPYSKFVKEEVFDSGAFSKAVDAEIKDWVDRGVVESSVKGSGFNTTVDDPEKLSKQRVEKENTDIAAGLLSHVGQDNKKKDGLSTADTIAATVVATLAATNAAAKAASA